MVTTSPLPASSDAASSVTGSTCFRLSTKAALVIAIYGAAILLPRLGGARVLTRHECFFCEPAKEMVASGDWLLPRFADVPCTFYPPGMHWSIALTASLAGGIGDTAGGVNEAILRFPSVLAGIATALMIAALAARWFGSRVGLVTGLVELTTYHFLTQARLAEADMLLALTVCTALGCFAWANVPGPSGRSSARWLPWLFYLAAGAAFLTKALLGMAFIFSACLTWILLSRDWRGREWRAVRFLLNPVGLLVFLACVLGWSVAAYQRCPEFLHMQLVQNVGRFQGELGGRKGSFFYVYSLLLQMLPWTPFLLWTLVRIFRQRSYREPWWQFTACWTLPGLVLLSIGTFQAKHYLVSLLPPLSILGALGLLDLLDRRETRSKLHFSLVALLTTVGCAAGAVVVERLGPDGAHAIAALIGMVGVGLLAVIYLEFRRWWTARLVAVFATAGVAIVVVLSLIMPYHDSYRCHTELAERTNAAIPDGTPLYLTGICEDQIVFYLRRPLLRVDDLSRLPAIVPRETGEFYAIGRASTASDLARLGDVETLDRSVRRGRNLPEERCLVLYRVKVAPDRMAAASPRTGKQ